MKVAVKYLILIAGFIAALGSFNTNIQIIGPGITAAGAFIAFAILEIYDLKIDNEKTEED
jgi:hypothetical protein